MKPNNRRRLICLSAQSPSQHRPLPSALPETHSGQQEEVGEMEEKEEKEEEAERKWTTEAVGGGGGDDDDDV